MLCATTTVLNFTACDKQPTESMNLSDEYPSEWYLFPTWSPTGEWIAYEHYAIDSLFGIWLVRPDGSKAHFETSGILPDFSPDGKQLALVRREKIFTYDLETKERTQLTFKGSSFFPRWSPDGEKIAYDFDYSSIWTMDADGLNKKEIGISEEASWRAPDWLPDFSILNQRRLRRSSDEPSVSTDLFVINSTGSEKSRLTTSGRENRNGKVSPDGRKIVWERWERNKAIAVWLMNADGSSKVRLTDGFEPDWAPAGRHIIFRKRGEYTIGEGWDEDDPKVHGSLWIMNLDTKEQWQFLPPD